MTYPEQFGQPCWEKDQAENCINIIAQVGSEKASLFLTTHTPIKDIKDARADNWVNEEEAFQSIFSRKGEIRVVVRGDVGTGKSHLIRWMNLRSEYAAKNKELGMDKFKIVMVQRDTGSLKTALKQIVDQLGSEFSQYTESIKSSVDMFSDETVREELITELALVINKKWKQLGHEPFSKDIKALGDVLLSPGYRKWLGRDGGIVAEIIARWTESSTPEDREKDINFTRRELIPKPGFLNQQHDAPEVHDFVDDFIYDEDIAKETVKVLKLALIDAQRELSGIKGTKLGEIFTAIRHELYNQGKQLAVFIEDVTAASGGLDLDLFQAFEPVEREGACRMVALLGMSNVGCWNILPDNEKHRVNFEFDIGGNAAQWATDPKKVAQFAARYLNALRCDNQEIDDLAKGRFASYIPKSKCDECQHLDTCHKIFGYAELEGEVKIGLFPFSEIAPQKLLATLNEHDHRTSPRGFLTYVLQVALVDSYDQLVTNTFPIAKFFGIQRPALKYWADFENKYLGGAAWSSGSNRDRARFLAEFWLEANSADEAASSLVSYRTPLSLPVFSAETIKRPVKKDEDKDKNKKLEPEPVDNEELDRLIVCLDKWERCDPLTSDKVFRELIAELIRGAFHWNDFRGISFREAKKKTEGYAYIKFEGQQSKPAGQQFFINFDRNKYTRSLLEALLRYDMEGKGSWDFENGELHKRTVYEWLRKNEQKIVGAFEPTPASLTNDAVKAASQLLALVAIFGTRLSLPKKDSGKRIKEVFSTIWDDNLQPKALTDSLNGVIYDIKAKWKDARELLVNELGVGSGKDAPKNFIDPLPILEALEKFEEKPFIEIPPPEISDSFWKKRFGAVAKLGSYVDLSQKLKEEREQIKKYLDDIKKFLIDAGFGVEEMKKQLGTCVKEIVEVIEIEKKNLKYPPAEFEELWCSERLQNNDKRDEWCASVHNAAKIVDCDCPRDIDTLCFKPDSLQEVWKDLTVVTEKHLEAIENELSDQEKPGGDKQEGNKEELLNELKQICEILDKK